MTRDWSKTKEWKAYAARIRRDVLPKIDESAVCVAITPGSKPDIKVAVEMGMILWLDKPLIILVTPGSKVPSRLAKAADAIIEWDKDAGPDMRERVAEKIKQLADDAERAGSDG